MADLPELPDVSDDEASIPGEGAGREPEAREISMLPQKEPLSKLEKDRSLAYRQASRFGLPKLLGWPVGTLSGPRKLSARSDLIVRHCRSASTRW